MKMKELAERYLRIRRDEMGKATFANVRSTVCRFAETWDKTRRTASSLDEEWVSDYLYSVREGATGRGKPLSPGYYNKEVDRLRQFLDYLSRRGTVNSFVLDACKHVPAGEPKEFLRLTVAQVAHMIRTCEDPWERWVLAFASQTIGRESELLFARVAHLHLDRGEMYWYRRKVKNEDMLPITRQLREEWDRWVRVYQEHCGSIERGWFLIPARVSTPLREERRWVYRPEKSPNVVGPIIQKHAARVIGVDLAELKGQGAHIMRRSMARALYDRLVADGVPEPTAVNRVQVMLGHSDPRTTMIYIGVQPDRQKRNELLTGSSLLWVEDDNVVQLRSVNE